MVDYPSIVVVILICITLASVSQYAGIMTASGNILAFIEGLITGLASLSWLIVLLVFLFTSVGVTRYGFDRKKAAGLQEGNKGERGWRNVAANGAVPLFIAALMLFSPALFNYPDFTVLFLSSVAVAASDTAASEIGVLNPKAYLITSFRRVKAGINGGVSSTGELWAFLAALYTSLVAAGFLFIMDATPLSFVQIAIPIVAGFVGCQIDSVIGATLENSGYIGKLGNNLVSIALGTLIALVMLLYL